MTHDIDLLSGNQIHLADNLEVLCQIPGNSVPLIYIDPPFNTGRTQSRTRIRTTRAVDGDRIGFLGQSYQTVQIGSHQFADSFDDYLAFLEPRLIEAHRVLAHNGTLYVHLDYREVHYVKVMLDQLFGRASFINEIIWAYDYGARSKRKWPAKHDTILMYARDPKDYVFNADDIDREPYMAPGLVGPEKAARGKLPTDTWWHTIVPTAGSERTGYPTQKPLGILRRIIRASSHPGDLVLDFFAGSGTTGMAAHELDRRFLLIDSHPEAFAVMTERFRDIPDLKLVSSNNNERTVN